MADIVTNISVIGDYTTWLAGLPGSDDGNVYVANFTVAGDYSIGQIAAQAVAIRLQADNSVKYNFNSPTDSHVAFTATTTETIYPRSTQPVEIKGVRLETASTTQDNIRAGAFEACDITINECRIIGGKNGGGFTNASAKIHFNNCVITDCDEFGIRGASVGVTATHCVVVNCNTTNNTFRAGIQTTSGAAFDSNVCFDNMQKDWFDTNGTATNNASGDLTAFGTSAVTGVVAGDFTNVAAGIYTAANGGALDGTGSGGTDIGLQLAVVNSITITTPAEYFLKARNPATNQGDLTITGTYAGSVVPTAIEASFNGGAFQTIDASPSGGTYSGTLTNQPSGNGSIIVRFTNDNAINSSRANVAIGIKCLFWGQSNFSGRADNAQTYTGTTGFFHKYTVTNDIWQVGNDPFDTATASGSLFPILANLMVADKNIPVGFIGVAQGSTTLSQWQSGQSLNTRMLDYLTNSGGNDVEVIASWIGESDATGGTSETDFKNQYNAVIDQLKTLTGMDSVLCGIAQSGTASDNVRQWIQDIVSTNANAVEYVDMAAEYTGVHYMTDTETVDCATALFNGINTAFFSSTFNFNITGIPDGTFTTVLDDESGNRVFRGPVTYASEAASQSVTTNVGTRLKGYVDDNSDPSTNAAYIEGVTV